VGTTRGPARRTGGDVVTRIDFGGRAYSQRSRPSCAASQASVRAQTGTSPGRLNPGSGRTAEPFGWIRIGRGPCRQAGDEPGIRPEVGAGGWDEPADALRDVRQHRLRSRLLRDAYRQQHEHRRCKQQECRLQRRRHHLHGLFAKKIHGQVVPLRASRPHASEVRRRFASARCCVREARATGHPLGPIHPPFGVTGRQFAPLRRPALLPKTLYSIIPVASPVYNSHYPARHPRAACANHRPRWDKVRHLGTFASGSPRSTIAAERKDTGCVNSARSFRARVACGLPQRDGAPEEHAEHIRWSKSSLKTRVNLPSSVRRRGQKARFSYRPAGPRDAARWRASGARPAYSARDHLCGLHWRRRTGGRYDRPTTRGRWNAGGGRGPIGRGLRTTPAKRESRHPGGN
jgi:hypothetical protein